MSATSMCAHTPRAPLSPARVVPFRPARSTLLSPIASYLHQIRWRFLGSRSTCSSSARNTSTPTHSPGSVADSDSFSKLLAKPFRTDRTLGEPTSQSAYSHGWIVGPLVSLAPSGPRLSHGRHLSFETSQIWVHRVHGVHRLLVCRMDDMVSVQPFIEAPSALSALLSALCPLTSPLRPLPSPFSPPPHSLCLIQAEASAAAPASEAAMACAAAMQPSTEALSYRIGGMLGILVSSIIGFALPFLLRGRHKTLLFFFRAMAAGIVLAVAIVHIFPGAQEALSNPCLDISSSPFPWAPVFILFSALFSFLVECYLKKLLLLSWRRKHPSAAATSAADSVSSAGGSSNRSGGKKRRLGAGGVGRVARVVAALLAGGRRKKGAGISKGGNGGGSGGGRGNSKRDGRLREDGKQQKAWQTDGDSIPDVTCHVISSHAMSSHAAPPCCDAPCSAAAVACHDTACHDATCHDIPCHEVVCHDATCHDTTCHDATCPEVTCPEAICHDCPESTCHSTACHEITCHDATCHDATCHDATCHESACQGITCPDTTCPDNACRGVTCLEATCPSAACGQSQCAGSKCVDSTCTDAKCIDAKCLAKCCETKCAACPDCALDVRGGEEDKSVMKSGKAAEWEEQEGREESEERQMREAVALSSLRAVAYTLEMGIIFHSIFIGIALGANHDSAEIKGLAIALVFHQGFEGISLGTAVAPCRFSLLKTLCMGLLFAFTTPLGVAIGLAVHSSYNSNSQAALATEGAFNAVSAGILIYNGLVDLLVPTFDEHDENTPKDPVAYFFGFVFLFLGAGAMSLLAIWA
ncbi:unnamed protein product [Closterium sp. NIES-54]